jgi:hypothetical protein
MKKLVLALALIGMVGTVSVSATTLGNHVVIVKTDKEKKEKKDKKDKKAKKDEKSCCKGKEEGKSCSGDGGKCCKGHKDETKSTDTK